MLFVISGQNTLYYVTLDYGDRRFRKLQSLYIVSHS